MLEKYALLRVMEGVFAEPGKDFSAREFAREIGIGAGTAGACFRYLLGKGMVSCRHVGRSKLYRTNLDSALVRQWKIVFSLERICKSGLVDFISSACAPLSLLLYGSLAKGTDDLKSDVDLLLIALGKKRMDLSAYQPPLRREVNLLAYTPAEWRAKAREDRVFYKRVIMDSIVLVGEKPVVE